MGEGLLHSWCCHLRKCRVLREVRFKKITGSRAKDHYTVVDPDGVVHQLVPEYVTMSLNPAIAKGWYESYSNDVYPSDFVVLRGKKMKPPKYYDRLLELADPAARLEIKEEREEYARLQKENSTPERLNVREKVTVGRISSLKRSLE